MLAVSSREILLERRHFNPEKSALWDKLSLAQKFAASSLNQFGYDLAFVRSSNIGCTAVLLCNGESATISSDGDIDTSPALIVRT